MSGHDLLRVLRGSLGRCVLLTAVVLSTACGGGNGNGGGTGGNGDGNDNASGGDEGGGDGGGGQTLTVTILGWPESVVAIGEGVILDATVSGAGPQATYAWSVDPSEEAMLTEGDAAVTFLPFDAGTFIISLTVTDPATSQSAGDDGTVEVQESSLPLP